MKSNVVYRMVPIGLSLPYSDLVLFETILAPIGPIRR